MILIRRSGKPTQTDSSLEVREDLPRSFPQRETQAGIYAESLSYGRS